MSVDYYQHLIIGCKIDINKIKIPERVRNCDCDIQNIDTIKYCPECGRAAWVDSWKAIEGYDETDYPATFLNMPLVYDTDEANCWVAIQKQDLKDDISSSIKFKNIEDIEALKKEIKSKLEPIGLWNEEDFGIWAIQNISY